MKLLSKITVFAMPPRRKHGIQGTGQHSLPPPEDITQPARRKPLLVSCDRSLGMRWLIPRFSQFQDAHPDLPVYLPTGSGPIDLARESVDLAVRRADFALDPRVPCLPLFPEYIGPVGLPGLAGKAVETRLHSTGRPDARKTWSRRASPQARAVHVR